MFERSFGYYVRVLIDMNLNKKLRDRILVERKGYAFFVDVEYENLLDFCTFCKCTGHHIDICKRKPLNAENIPMQKHGAENVDKQSKPKKVAASRIMFQCKKELLRL